MRFLTLSANWLEVTITYPSGDVTVVRQARNSRRLGVSIALRRTPGDPANDPLLGCFRAWQSGLIGATEWFSRR
jgi:hypothetical protein